MLNYENTQLLLIEARKKDIQEKLEIDLNEEKETENMGELFKELRIKRRTSASETTIGRRVSRQDRTANVARSKATVQRRGSRTRRQGGGKAAATRASSAAAVAKILSGTDFSKSKSELVSQAEKNRQKVEAPEETIQIIREFPDREYANMAHIKKSLGQVLYQGRRLFEEAKICSARFFYLAPRRRCRFKIGNILSKMIAS